MRMPKGIQLLCVALIASCGGAGSGVAQPPVETEVTEVVSRQEAMPDDYMIANPEVLQGEPAEVRLASDGKDGFPLIARIEADGTLHPVHPFPLTAPRHQIATVAEAFGKWWGECDSEWNENQNGDVFIDPLNPYATGGALGDSVGLVAVSSEALLGWFAQGLPFEEGDSYLEFYYVSEAAHAKGQCTQTDQLDLHYDVSLSPGLNLVRVKYVSITPFGDGTLEYSEVHLTSETDFPEDMKWYLIPPGTAH